MRLELKIGLGILALIGTFFLVQFALIYLLPFILAVLVAILIEPLVSFFEKRLRLKRGFAVAIVLLLVLLIFIVFIIAGVAQIYQEIEKLSKNFPDYQVIWDRYQWLLNQNGEVQNLLERWNLLEGQEKEIERILQDIYAFIQENFKVLITAILGFLAKLPNLITIFMISFMATFFISRDRQMFANLFWRLVPKKWQRKLRTVKKELTSAVVGFLRAELILVSITTIIAIVGLEIMGSDYALVLGFASGALDLIPIIGPTLIFIPWAIYSMATGSFGYGIGLLIVYGVLAVTRQIAEAKIIGKSIGVHPLAALVSMYVGVKIFGVGGFIIGPATVIVLKALYKAGIITLSAAKKE